MLATAPAEANIFYDMEFFDEAGELVGTGEFSHDETPFEGDAQQCISVFMPSSTPPYDEPVLTPICSESIIFERSQNVFRLNTFSTTVGLGFNPEFLFWRPFDAQPVAGIFVGGRSSFFDPFPSLSYSDSVWGISARYISLVMTATTWSFSVGSPSDGSGTWTATRRSTTSIPETTPVVGLLALGGVSLMMVSKRQS
jgi:hypothetical protein